MRRLLAGSLALVARSERRRRCELSSRRSLCRRQSFHSPGVDAGDYVYVSGQGPRQPDGSLPATLRAQVRQALDNVKAVVEAAGLTMDHVVYTQVYLEDISKYPRVNEVFAEVFPKTRLRPREPFWALPSFPIRRFRSMPSQCADLAERAGGVLRPTTSRESRLSPGILTADRLFVSSMPGSDPATGKVPDDPAAQVDLALDRMKAVVEAAGLDLRQHGLRQSVSDVENSDARDERALRAALRVR